MLFPNMDYIKTMLNGISTKLSEIGKRAVKGNWQQNDPEASDYIKNRCGGYHVTNTRKIQLTPEWPEVINNTTGIMTKRFDVATSSWAIHVSDDIPSPDELSSAEIADVGFDYKNLTLFRPEKDFYYLSAQDDTSLAYFVTTPIVLVVAKPMTMYNITFDRSGLYIGCVTQFTNKIAYVTSLSYERSEDTIVKIPQEYVDGAGSLRVNITKTNGNYTADRTFEEIKQAYDSGMTVYAIAAPLNNIPLIAVDDRNGALFSVNAPVLDRETYVANGGILQSKITFVVENDNSVVFLNNPFNGPQVFAIPQQFMIQVTKDSDGTCTADKTSDWIVQTIGTFLETSNGEGLPDIVAAIKSDLFHLTNVSPITFVCEGDVTKILTCEPGANGDTWSYKEVAGGATFYFNLTEKDSVITSDKTPKEIYNAYEAGMVVIGIVNDIHVTFCDKPHKRDFRYSFWFSGVSLGNTVCIVSYGDTSGWQKKIFYNSPFIVKFTKAADGSITADQNPRDIFIAYNAGRVVLGNLDNKSNYNLTYAVYTSGNGYNVGFSKIDNGYAEFIYFNSYSVNPNAKWEYSIVRDKPLPKPANADVGQFIKVKTVKDGEVTETEATDEPVSLGISGAQVGQIAKITAVDAQGKPTAWEPVDMASGGEREWEVVADIITTSEDVLYYRYDVPDKKELIVLVSLTPLADSTSPVNGTIGINGTGNPWNGNYTYISGNILSVKSSERGGSVVLSGEIIDRKWVPNSLFSSLNRGASWKALRPDGTMHLTSDDTTNACSFTSVDAITSVAVGSYTKWFGVGSHIYILAR